MIQISGILAVRCEQRSCARQSVQETGWRWFQLIPLCAACGAEGVARSAERRPPLCSSAQEDPPNTRTPL